MPRIELKTEIKANKEIVLDLSLIGNNLMKTLLAIFIFGITSISLSAQNVIINTTDDASEGESFDVTAFKIVEPQNDTIHIKKSEIFSIEIYHSKPLESLYIHDYPEETYADIHGLKKPETYEELDKLELEEWAKYRVLVRKTEVMKNVQINGKTFLEVMVTSERITYFDLYLNDVIFKRFYIQLE